MDEKRGSDGPENPGESDGREAGRSESLDVRRQRLDAELLARRKVDPKKISNQEAANGYALAVKLSSEFIAGVIVGALLGYLIDKFMGTAPWGMIVFLLLGFCAGVLNVLRSTGAVAQSDSTGRNKAGGREEDDRQ
ncbi:AtpZ/AtpI family protein [Hoeflea sp. Naph1]|jgi:ATP synthase protein I|uniref:AtpZ/AtpI family protein n=1 Tax=Hoeflea sp. Naph1 TaxID=3388653 RepID=UPI00398FFE26